LNPEGKIMALEIYSREKHGVVILDLRGNIDINASEFIETVGWHLANHRLDLLCDFKHVDMIDYAGLSVLTIAYKNVVNHDGRMKFFNVPVSVRNVFRAVMLDRIFEFYETEEIALNAFKEDKEIQKIQKMQLRRRFKRVALDLPVAYKAKYGDNKEYKGKILDLSGEGAFIFGKKTFALHDILTLEFDLQHIGKVGADVRVVWLSDKELQPHQYPGMGVEFYKISVAEQKKIVSFVDKNLDARSAPHQPPL
jgi:anti-anti-sigma factor